MWNQNGRIPYITYEYTILRESLSPVPPPPLYTGQDGATAAGASVEVGAMVVAPNGSVGDKTQVLKQGGPSAGEDEGPKGQETNEVYVEAAAIDCHQDGPTPPQYTGRDDPITLALIPVNLTFSVVVGGLDSFPFSLQQRCISMICLSNARSTELCPPTPHCARETFIRSDAVFVSKTSLSLVEGRGRLWFAGQISDEIKMFEGEEG